MDFGLMLLRVTVGLTMSAHGAQKLFGWFNGPGIEGTARGMEALGFHPGKRHATIAGLTEFGGGLMLALGLVTPLGAALVASVMLVAALSAHVKQGFFMTAGGYEYTLVLGVAAVTLAFVGPGAFSVDALVGLPVTCAAIWYRAYAPRRRESSATRRASSAALASDTLPAAVVIAPVCR
jgi:putative oxidoreductase